MSQGSKRWLPSSHPLGYMEASRKTKIPLKPKLRYTPTEGTLGICLRSTIGRMPGDRTLRSLDASLAIPTCVLCLEAFGALRPQTGQTSSQNRSGRFRPDSHARSSASALWLIRVTRWFSGGPPQTPRTWYSHPPITTHDFAPTKSRLEPWFCGSTKKPSTDFILLFLPPCGPHLTLLAIGSLKRSLLFFSTLGGLTGNDLSRLFFTCTKTSQAETWTCNT
jgi:hypothetical protein